MLHLHTSRFVWILALTFGLWAVAAQAHEFRYRYVPLDQVELPPGFIFFEAIAINNSGRVYGNAYECSNAACDSILPHIAVYANGAVTVLQPGIVYTANERGIIGGKVLIDPTNFIEQAALFRGDQVELIPPQPGEVTSIVIALNDRGTALVRSDDDLGQPSYALYHNGQKTPLDFGPTVTRPVATGMNNQGTISGTDFFIGGSRGFRFDPRTGETTVLNPLPGESYAWGLGINNRGDVLGYSFVDFGLREDIGVWDHEGEFKTYFVEGIPEFPTLSNRLLFNDNNLIVITFTTDNKSYLVPRPGVRLNLAELVENLPLGGNLTFIQDINNDGDMIGSDFGGGIFLLKRIGATRLQSSATTDGATQSPSGVKNRGHDIPMTAATTLRAMLRRHLLPLKSGAAPLPYDPLESLLLK